MSEVEVAERASGAGQRIRWWQEWLRPPSLLTVASVVAFAVIWYTNVGAHCADATAAQPRYHHTSEELRREFVSLDVHLQQEQDNERRLNEINTKIDRLESKVDRLLERP